jgi:hypothetical protein
MTPLEAAKLLDEDSPLATKDQAMKFGQQYFAADELTTFLDTWQKIHDQSAAVRKIGFMDDMDRAFQG